MNADCDFQIGKDHLVCQDYALVASREGEAYVILCDGCSASPDVDIGARLLAMSAKETLLQRNNHDWQSFGLETITRANSIFSTYPHFHPQALDATLWVASILGTELKAFLYGDGVFYHKSKNGVYAMRVELTHGAPDYLSYNREPQRKEDYIKLSEEDKEMKELTIYEDGIRKVERVKPFEPVTILRTVEPGDVVAVSSDGIGSFQKIDSTYIPWFDLLDEFFAFKSLAGVFVKRRLGTFRKKCLAEGITHYDDISVGAIIV